MELTRLNQLDELIKVRKTEINKKDYHRLLVLTIIFEILFILIPLIIWVNLGFQYIFMLKSVLIFLGIYLFIVSFGVSLGQYLYNYYMIELLNDVSPEDFKISFKYLFIKILKSNILLFIIGIILIIVSIFLRG